MGSLGEGRRAGAGGRGGREVCSTRHTAALRRKQPAQEPTLLHLNEALGCVQPFQLELPKLQMNFLLDVGKLNGLLLEVIVLIMLNYFFQMVLSSSQTFRGGNHRTWNNFSPTETECN